MNWGDGTAQPEWWDTTGFKKLERGGGQWAGRNWLEKSGERQAGTQSQKSRETGTLNQSMRGGSKRRSARARVVVGKTPGMRNGTEVHRET